MSEDLLDIQDVEDIRFRGSWRVSWALAGSIGHGSWNYDREVVQSWVEAMNAEYGIGTHWGGGV